MGIVYHSRYFPWFECARIEMLDDLGVSYREMETLGVRLPVVEVNCRYRQPAYFDDRIVIDAEVRELPKARLEVFYNVLREDETLLCEGRTLHGFMDLNNRPCRPPAVVQAAFVRAFQSQT